MGRVWVLDTETKGTGAEMVPLDRVQRRGAPERERLTVVRRKPRGRDEEVAELAPQPREPLRFKVVDVMSRRTLAEDVDARTAAERLEGARSVADVRVYVWEPGVEEWRPLTLGEQTTLRGLGARESAATDAALSG